MSAQKIAWILPFLGDIKQVAQTHGLEALAADLDGLINRHGDEILAADEEAGLVSETNVVSFVKRAGAAGNL